MRTDLADIRLAGSVFAPRYAAPVARTALERAFIRTGPKLDSDPVSEVLMGDRFELLDIAADWAWGICLADGAVGYVPGSVFGPLVSMPADSAGTSIQQRAAAMIGTPRLQGGRSRHGLDEGGLVFVSVTAAGYAAPRFLDVQRTELGHELEPGAPLLPGDVAIGETGSAVVLDGRSAAALTPGLGLVERIALSLLDEQTLGAPVAFRRLP